MGYGSGQVLSPSLLLADIPCDLYSSTHLYRRSRSRGLGSGICKFPFYHHSCRNKYGYLKTFATIFQCVPPDKLWRMKTPGYCGSKYKYFLGTAIPEVVTDFVILAMPLPYIWNLQMKLRQKVLLSLVFILGGL